MICGCTGYVYHGDQMAKKDMNAVLNQIQNYICSVSYRWLEEKSRLVFGSIGYSGK